MASVAGNIKSFYRPRKTTATKKSSKKSPIYAAILGSTSVQTPATISHGEKPDLQCPFQFLGFSFYFLIQTHLSISMSKRLNFVCRWIQWERGGVAAIRFEHGVRALRRDTAACTVPACSEVRFEPSAGNRESLEEWESSDGVLVGWLHLESLWHPIAFCVIRFCWGNSASGCVPCYVTLNWTLWLQNVDAFLLSVVSYMESCFALLSG